MQFQVTASPNRIIPSMCQSTVSDTLSPDTRTPMASATIQQPLVGLSDNASPRTKQLWWRHGDPYSKRFANPDLTSLASLVRFNAQTVGNDVAFLCPSSDGFQPITWQQFDAYTDIIAAGYAHQLKSILDEANTTKKLPTVALWGAGHKVEYFATQMALAKLHVRVLLLADTANAQAVSHLVHVTNVSVIVADAKLAKKYSGELPVVPMMEDLPQLGLKATTVPFVTFDDGEDPWNRHAFIIHSSGSTGMPKPIIHTNRSLMQIARMYRRFPDFDVENWLLLFPLFHVAGFSIILSGLPTGLTTSFPPRTWPPRASAILETCQSLEKLGHPVDCIHTAPMVIESMVEYIESSCDNDFSDLAKLKILQPGGAMLSASVVTKLVNKGVNVKTTYGSTEIGPPFRSIPHTRDNPECYRVANLYPDNDKLKMEDVGGGLYECVVYKGFELAAELWEGLDENTPYRTNDLFIQDPPGSGYFYLTGRRDDVLVHSTGENTNANPIEVDLKGRCKLVQSLVLLGHGRPCTSLLVELRDPEKSDPTQLKELWEAVDYVNGIYPRHSVILRSMVHILSPGQQLPVTPKGNVKRREAEKQFQDVIETLYSDDDDSTAADQSSGEVPKANTLQGEPLKEALRVIISQASGATPLTGNSQEDDDRNFSDLGIDSIGAIKLRSVLVKQIGPITLGAIFEYSSISRLDSYYTPKSPSTSPSSSSTDAFKSYIKSTISSQTSSLLSSFPPSPPLSPSSSSSSSSPFDDQQPPSETILLTGATGSLGTSLLFSLLSSPRIRKIYCLTSSSSSSSSSEEPNNLPPNHPSLVSKLRRSLAARNINIITPPGKNHLEEEEDRFVVLPYNMADEQYLGLGHDLKTYEMLRSEVTTVVHGAWRMDFNRRVDEFGDCLRGAVALLKFCASGGGGGGGEGRKKKIFCFVSSVAACLGEGSVGKVIQEARASEEDDMDGVLGTGYAGGKYIVEKVCQRAAETGGVGVPVKILRLGQMYGHTGTGAWNQEEMFPIMLATSLHLGALPTFPDKRTVDWIPVDVAADTISDIILSSSSSSKSSDLYSVHNIVNPHPIYWDQFLAEVQGALPEVSLALIPMSQWVSKLDQAVQEYLQAGGSDLAAALPGSKLLNFFEDMAGGDSPSSGESGELTTGITFATDRTRKISPALRACRPVNRELLGACFGWWREKRLLGLGGLRKDQG